MPLPFDLVLAVLKDPRLSFPLRVVAAADSFIETLNQLAGEVEEIKQHAPPDLADRLERLEYGPADDPRRVQAVRLRGAVQQRITDTGHLLCVAAKEWRIDSRKLASFIASPRLNLGEIDTVRDVAAALRSEACYRCPDDPYSVFHSVEFVPVSPLAKPGQAGQTALVDAREADEDLRARRQQYELYRSMLKHPSVRRARSVLALRITSAGWRLEWVSHPPAMADGSIERCLNQLPELLVKDATTVLDYGWAAFEVIWQVRDKLHLIDRLKWLSPDGTKLRIDAHGNFAGVVNRGIVRDGEKATEGNDVPLSLDKSITLCLRAPGDRIAVGYGRSQLENIRHLWVRWREGRAADEIDERLYADYLGGDIGTFHLDVEARHTLDECKTALDHLTDLLLRHNYGAQMEGRARWRYTVAQAETLSAEDPEDPEATAGLNRADDFIQPLLACSTPPNLDEEDSGSIPPAGIHKAKRKSPPPNAFAAYRACVVAGARQTEVAVRLGVNQGQISKWVKAVTDWLEAGNVLPDLTPAAAKPVSVDPAVLDMGARQDRRTRRQRERQTDED